MMMCSIPEAIASSTPYWMMGLSTTASISFGITLVAGKKRVPNPPAGKTAFRTRFFIASSSLMIEPQRVHRCSSCAHNTRSFPIWL
jgi:hypothetical protein